MASGPAPTLTATPASTFTAFTTQQGTPSAAQSYTLTGTNLTADVTVTPPTGYQVSQTSATSGFNGDATAITVLQADAAAGKTIYVRLSGATAGIYGTSVSPISVSNASTGATTQNVAVYGNTTNITVAPASLTSFNTTQSIASSSQTYALTGAGLTGSITVTAPSGYEVAQSPSSSTTTPNTYAGGQTVTQSSGNASATIYVRLAAATLAGSYGGDVTNASTNATSRNVAVSGTVAAPVPTLTASAPSLTAFNAPAGTPSAARTYTLTGANLTGDITVTAPTNFELSLTGAAGSYASTQMAALANVQAAGGQLIYVRVAANTAGTYNGNVTNSGGGAATQSVAVSGTSVAQPAATPAPAVSAGSLTTTSAVLTLTAGAGTNLLVVVRPSTGSNGTATTATAPTNGTAYTGNTAYGSGTALGSGFVVFADANATSVAVTGLTSGTSYVADVYTYTIGTAAGGENYGSASGTTTFTTVAPTPSAPGVLLLEDDFNYSVNTRLTANGWVAHSGGSNNDDPDVLSSSLTRFTYPVGASSVGVSNQAYSSSTGADVNRGFAAATGQQTYYYTALIKLPSANTSNSYTDYFLHLMERNAAGTTGSNFRARLLARPNTAADKYVLGVALTSGATYSTAEFEFDRTYLVVVKYLFVPGGNDAVSLYVFDDSNSTALPATEPSATTAGPVTAANNSSFAQPNSIAIRQTTTTPLVYLDGIRVATGWGAAIGRPVFTDANGTLAAGSYYNVRVVGTGAKATASGAAFVEGILNLDGGQIATTSANVLTLRPNVNAQVNNGGTSFVDGPLARQTDNGPTLIFPIGRNGNYRPLTLNISAASTGALTTYTAVQNEGQSTDQKLNLPLLRISQVRYYTVTPSTLPSNASFNITLSFGSDDQVTDPSLGTFVVAKSDGSGWSSIGRLANSNSDLTSGTFTSFSDFILASTEPLTTINPLPVTLTSFTATRTAGGVQVAWATASEQNSGYFEVERSLDGHTFARVAKVAAHGTTAQSHTYASLDGAAPAALLYYRLRQVDLDGTVAYSPVVTVAATDGATAEFSLAPNPARERIGFFTALPTAYSVRNTLGQLVRSGTTQAGTNNLLVGELPAGVYFFELHNGNGRVVRKFAKE